jgi:hypothetical protein
MFQRPKIMLLADNGIKIVSSTQYWGDTEKGRGQLPVRKEADQEIASATIVRPTAAQVQEAWSEILRVWEVLTEDERGDLLGSIVQVVEMTEKESVTLELLPMSHSLMDYSHRFELKSSLGAGAGLEPATFGL